MKLKILLLLLLVAVFPSSLFSNTLYFPQVAFGGGYSTTFVIVNTGTVNISSRLTFYDQKGAPRTDLDAQIDIVAGSSTRFTLPNVGPLTVVWAEFAPPVSSVQGVATFDVRDNNGTLTTSAGVLGVEGGASYRLPVDVTATSSTGIAIGNSTGSSLAVSLRLLGENGAQVAASTVPLGSRGQVADFVGNIFPQIAGTSFKGTMVIEAPAGAPANALAATALTVKEGLLSALPIIPGGSPGITTLDFPQVAFGGGYSTTFIIMNTGTTAVTSQLKFYSQGGGARTDLGTSINIPAGGSTRYTLPNTGTLITVVWGELTAGAGAVQGVATFDLRNSNGTLGTTAGVLGIQPGSGFTLPVDVTASGSTGIAISNTQDGAAVAVRLRLFGETGSLFATATDTRFAALAPRGQVADFVTNIFPQLAGTNFKGSLAIDTTGAAANSLAATALTIKEGLLSALPVIAGAIAGNGSGGGGGGGGGGTGGGGAASACIDTNLFSSAVNVHLDYLVSGALSGTSISDTVSTPNVQFEGQSTIEFRSTVNTTYTGLPAVLSSVRSYQKLDGTDILTFGSLTEFSASGVSGTTKSVFSPPARDKRYSLAVGASATQTYSITSTTTITGLPAPITQTASQTETVKYLGRETVTVPAGTFVDACKFDQNNGATIMWTAAGSAAGVAVKSTSVGSGSAATVLELRSATVNGAAVKP